MTQIQIDCPDDLLAGESMPTLANLAQQAFLVRLYQLGQVSSGKAAEILHVSRRRFLEILGEYGVSIFDEEMNIEAEARCGR
jgi:hypothetical protein